MSELLQPPDVARILGVGLGWVYDHLEELPHIRLGSGTRGPIRFRRQDIDTYLAERVTTRQVAPAGLRPKGRRRA